MLNRGGAGDRAADMLFYVLLLLKLLLLRLDRVDDDNEVEEGSTIAYYYTWGPLEKASMLLLYLLSSKGTTFTVVSRISLKETLF